jgi:hypothetical protein
MASEEGILSMEVVTVKKIPFFQRVPAEQAV